MKMFIHAPWLVHIIEKKGRGVLLAAVNQDGVTIGTISGGIVNFGGAVTIAPISITKTVSGSGTGNQGGTTTTSSGGSSSPISETSLNEILDIIRRSLE
ncbi:spore germination protein [Neobacillus cucumis]|uniref:spore germination protein n=1 Tax=Neobacillus cucumis TaxID=1740721 RepID=UPI002E1EF0C0|nr:spore germination protein [Neobacillus cucumis]